MISYVLSSLYIQTMWRSWVLLKSLILQCCFWSAPWPWIDRPPTWDWSVRSMMWYWRIGIEFRTIMWIQHSVITFIMILVIPVVVVIVGGCNTIKAGIHHQTTCMLCKAAHTGSDRFGLGRCGLDRSVDRRQINIVVVWIIGFIIRSRTILSSSCRKRSLDEPFFLSSHQQFFIFLLVIFGSYVRLT